MKIPRVVFHNLPIVHPMHVCGHKNRLCRCQAIFASPHSQFCLLFFYTFHYNYQNNYNAYIYFFALSAYSIARLLQKINTI